MFPDSGDAGDAADSSENYGYRLEAFAPACQCQLPHAEPLLSKQTLLVPYVVFTVR